MFWLKDEHEGALGSVPCGIHGRLKQKVHRHFIASSTITSSSLSSTMFHGCYLPRGRELKKVWITTSLPPRGDPPTPEDRTCGARPTFVAHQTVPLNPNAPRAAPPHATSCSKWKQSNGHSRFDSTRTRGSIVEMA